MPDALGAYLKTISAYALLSPDEEIELGHQIKQGDCQAKETMIKANLRLVVNTAKKYSGSGVPFLDLIQEGNIGLLAAVESFDPEHGNKFSTYAVRLIRNAINQCIRKNSRTILLPENLHRLSGFMKRQMLIIFNRTGFIPSEEELTEMLIDILDDMVEERKRGGKKAPSYYSDKRVLMSQKIRDVSQADRSIVYLSQPMDDHGHEDLDYCGIIADESLEPQDDWLQSQEIHRLVSAAVSSLNDDHAAFIRHRFELDGCEPRSVRDFANEWGIAPQTANSRRIKIMAGIRAWLAAKGINGMSDLD